MGEKEVREALKTLTKEEKAWLSANQDDNRVVSLRVRMSLAKSYGPIDDYEDRALITAIEDFKRWFKENNTPTPKNDKKQHTQQE